MRRCHWPSYGRAYTASLSTRTGLPRTSYYVERWGFCLSQRQLDQMPEGEYEVCIDSSLTAGSLTYGECSIAGDLSEEVLLSCHVCHPSLANDNLSGIALGTFAAKAIQRWPRRRYSYRILFIPGTIGSITWLALHEKDVARIKHGLVLTCVGDSGHCTYKRSRRGTAEIDHAVSICLAHGPDKHEALEFSPYGYDERQFCSPGFNLPVGCFMRTPNGRYPQYHTSADNLELVRPESLADSLEKLLAILAVLESNQTYWSTNQKCEPQLGKRGLYATMGGQSDRKEWEMALLWILNSADGQASLLDVAEKSGLKVAVLKEAADRLEQVGLVQALSHSPVEFASGARQ